jgi:hypothetical protein
LKGSITFPAVEHYGNPDVPIIAIWGFHPLVIIDVKIFLWALFSPPTIGNYLIALSPFMETKLCIY